ncbi:hypothetical protein MRB53_039401 [Persea americana]|nr:hypothetical protein MRB53_039401 [Persea americana]
MMQVMRSCSKGLVQRQDKTKSEVEAEAGLMVKAGIEGRVRCDAYLRDVQGHELTFILDTSRVLPLLRFSLPQPPHQPVPLAHQLTDVSFQLPAPLISPTVPARSFGTMVERRRLPKPAKQVVLGNNDLEIKITVIETRPITDR